MAGLRHEACVERHGGGSDRRRSRGSARKHGNIQLGQLGTLLFYTDRTLPHAAKSAVILACHPSKQLMGKLDAFRDASALIVLPWNREISKPGSLRADQRISWGKLIRNQRRSQIWSSSAPSNPSVTGSMSRPESAIHWIAMQSSKLFGFCERQRSTSIRLRSGRGSSSKGCIPGTRMTLPRLQQSRDGTAATHRAVPGRLTS